ncbi:type I-E CRISPR-associated protein Cas5/CasD [Streptomyces sp. NPDC004111]|uniref:type I-E CRISPR-associated protein Cas5/CasD n=1 Tax=Streptomyces sp. NPDC004111 TaxID=3364690 RepID=UPI003699B46F
MSTPAPPPTPHPGLLLRLAGPLSAYGTPSTVVHRPTAPHPTRGALIGLFASAAGRAQEHALAPHTDLPGTPAYHDLTFTVRIDNPGTPYTDFHTTGGGYPRDQQLRTSSGGRRAPGKSTATSRRQYLADAAFTVAVQGPAPLLDRLAATLEHPHWAPYLGRRPCIPDEPLVLGRPLRDPLTQLLHHVPLTLPTPPPHDQPTVPVAFCWESPPTHTPADAHYYLANDPVDLVRTRRRHRLYPVWRTTEHLPAALYAGPRPLPALTAYLQRETPCTPPR